MNMNSQKCFVFFSEFGCTCKIQIMELSQELYNQSHKFHIFTIHVSGLSQSQSSQVSHFFKSLVSVKLITALTSFTLLLVTCQR